MADNLVAITIGSPTTLVSGALNVDETTNTLLAGSDLYLDVGGSEVPVLNLSLTPGANGTTTVQGATAVGTGVTVQFQGTMPTSVSVDVTALGQPAVQATINATTAPVCYCTGTLIRTARGDVAVEDLAVGDLVVTASGEQRPIRWIGHRMIDLARHPDPHANTPVKVRAHAFGPDLPAADLFLSPGHAVRVRVVDDMLVPISKLLNGATVAKHLVDTVTYWHVELDSHDVLIANGLPAESFLDCGNRSALLEQEGTYDRTQGPHTPTDFCLPFVDRGPVVEAMRERLTALAARQGWRQTGDKDPHLLVDGVRVEPDIADGVARFLFPASAEEVVFASHTHVPSDFEDSLDHRSLGMSVHRFEVDDGLAVRRSWDAADDMFAGLFYPEEVASGAWHRLTTGRTRLPPALWANCSTHVMLRVGFDPQSGWRWIAPETSEQARTDEPASNVVNLRVA